ncbi:MAG TPA: methenyltetrahydromethanopterin cyclohydrolase [Candidatus Polarisedimenticolia bacterium]
MSSGIAIIHENAARIADEMEARAALLGLEVSRLGNGARLVDAGVRAPGSIEAGRLFAEACLGGLGRVNITSRPLGPATILEARVAVDRPLLACLGSQYAGWRVKTPGFFAMGSGPARALAAIEPLFAKLPLASRASRSVLLLETSTLPGEDVAHLIATRCGLAPDAVTLVAAATSSLAGATQIAARSVETALHKLLELGFDLETIVSGAGDAPIAPGHPDPLQAIGRTNDAVLYGASVSLWVRAEDAAVDAVLRRVPSSSSRDHGRLFHDLFREHGDFYKIDPMLFSPARVTFLNERTGRVSSAGTPDEGMLRRSFGIA